MNKQGLNSHGKKSYCYPGDPPAISSKCAKKIENGCHDGTAQNDGEKIPFQFIYEISFRSGPVKIKLLFYNKNTIEGKRDVDEIIDNKNDAKEKEPPQDGLRGLSPDKLVQYPEQSGVNYDQYDEKAECS